MDHAELRAAAYRYFREQLDAGKKRRNSLGPFSTSEKEEAARALALLQEGNREYWHLLGSENAKAELEQFFGASGLSPEEFRGRTPMILDEIRKARIGAYRAILDHSASLEAYDFSEPRTASQELPEAPPGSVPAGTLSEAVEAFFREHEKTAEWTAGTIQKRRAVLDLALEWFGPNAAMGGLGKKDAADFKAALLHLPPNRSKSRRLAGLSMREAIAVPDIPRISNATANAYLSVCKVFWEWAEAHGYASEVLFDGMKVGKKGHSVKERKPFTPAALEKTYSALTVPHSKHFKKTSHRWATLIAMFSGARLNEVCQLQVRDLVQLDGIWVFDFTEEGDSNKRLKSSAARRRVPIHSRLIELGLLQYRDQREQRGDSRLFPDYTYSPKHGYGDKLSKWFNRTFTQDLGIKSDAHVFHGLRHTFATQLGQADVPTERIQFIVGHERQGVTHQVYMKEGYTLSQTSDAVERFSV